MSSPNSWPFETFDAYLSKELRASTARERPPRAVREQLLRSAQWITMMGGEDERVKAAKRDRTGGYLELHHRLVGRGLFYLAPLGAQAGCLTT